MAKIEPVSIPSAAAVNYGNADVRHISETDPLDAANIAEPTRHLAHRDVELAKKLNEVVDVINSTEQFMPLPLPRTNVPALSEEIIYNFRIPFGFEARVVNAAITSTPQSASVKLTIQHNPTTFGGSTGESIVDTSTESTATSFYPAGEFIVMVRNTGDRSLEVVASVLLSMRSLGSVGVPAQAPPPPATMFVGPVGDPGIQGEPGVGIPGNKGFDFKGPWVTGTAYAPPDGVNHPDGGNVTNPRSVYICKAPHVADATNSPSGVNAAQYWELFVEHGNNGGSGAGEPTYLVQDVNGQLAFGGTYATSGASGLYQSIGTANTNTPYVFSEASIRNPASLASTIGVAFLRASLRLKFRGAITMTLPQTDNVAWDVTTVQCHVSAVGATVTPTVAVTAASTNAYTITVPGGTDQQVEISFWGFEASN
jgi:hypothetical protein